MSLHQRIKKRIFIFILIPVLASVQFFTDDMITKIIAAILLVVYVGFIIFLRDSMRAEGYSEDDTNNEMDEPVSDDEKETFDTDTGEDFKIVSENKKIEVASGAPSHQVSRNHGKSYFKPPDLKQNFEKIATERPPDNISHDEHFSFILEKILNVVKEAFLAHTSLFFWFNKKKKRLTLEKFSTSSLDIVQQKFDLEDDILSKIVQKEEPELLTDITPKAEMDVIRYYSKPQGIKSFVGVPLYFKDKLAGILAIDSKVNDAFGIETVYSLGRFVRVISLIITLFDEKFNENQSEQRLKALLDILVSDKKFDTEIELYKVIENSVQHLLPWDVFTFVYYDSIDKKFRTSKVNNKTSLKYIGENLEIDLTGTLVGKCIVGGEPIKVDDTSISSIPRFAKSEDLTFDGSFLVVPLTYDGQNYGVLCFESLKKNIYNSDDIEFLRKATRIFAHIVYSQSTQFMLRSLLSVDIETKLLNNNSFMEYASLELAKASDLNIPCSLAIVKIDDFIEEDSLFEGDPFPRVLKSIVKSIREETSRFNIVGRLDNRLIGIYFFNSSTKDVFLWAEKLRIKIARKPIAVVSKQTTFTISVGIATATRKTDFNEVMYNAELALNKATEKGGNSVKSL